LTLTELNPGILIFDNAMSTQFPSHLSLAQPNCKFNVDANSGHAFGILLAAVGALRPSGSGAS
jgi:hypothetical protein